MQNILLGLVPAFMWGIQPLVLSKMGGKPANKLLGLSTGALVFAAAVYAIQRPNIWSFQILIFSFLAGVAWSFGQVTQIYAYSLIGVSRSTPISTGGQLIASSLLGAFFLGEWETTTKRALGFASIVIVIVGVTLTAYSESKQEIPNLKKGMLFLLCTTVGFIIYSTLPSVTGIAGIPVILPQAVGMFFGAAVFALANKKNTDILDKFTAKNIITGMIFATANITMLLSNQRNGLALGYTLTQMNVVISTVGGILFLHEEKTRKEKQFVLAGLFFVVLGGVMIGFTKF